MNCKIIFNLEQTLCRTFMKKIFISFLVCSSSALAYSQNVGVNTDATTPEAGIMLDVKGTNSYSTTATQNIFQVKSFDANTTALKLRLGLSTGALLYGSIDVYDATSAVTRPLILQPTTGNVGIGNTSPAALVDVKGTNATAHLRLTSTAGRASLVLTSDVGNTSGPIITWSKQNVGEFAMYDYNGAAKLAIVDAATGNDAFSIMGGKTTIGNGSGISGNSSLNVYGNAGIGLTYYNSAAPANGLIVEGNVGIGTTTPTSKLQVVGLPVYANNAAALAGGLTAGALYTTGVGDPRPVYIVY